MDKIDTFGFLFYLVVSVPSSLIIEYSDIQNIQLGGNNFSYCWATGIVILLANQPLHF